MRPPWGKEEETRRGAGAEGEQEGAGAGCRLSGPTASASSTAPFYNATIARFPINSCVGC